MSSIPVAYQVPTSAPTDVTRNPPFRWKWRDLAGRIDDIGGYGAEP